jgi:hypothetical protein
MIIANNKGTLIDTIFLDSIKHSCISVYPLENGLSDHRTNSDFGKHKNSI